MFSIKSKIIFAYTFVFGLVLIAFAFVIYHSSKAAALEKLDARLQSYSASLKEEIEEQFNENEPLDINELKSLPTEGLRGT